jgi:hypothetical protein
MLQNLRNAAGQAERLRLVRRLRNATAGTVKIFSDDMKDNLQLPARRFGVIFAVESCLLVAFVTCLTVLAIAERSPETVREATRSISSWAGRHSLSSVGTLDETVAWCAMMPEWLSEIAANSIVVGDVTFSLLRSHVKQCTPPVGLPKALGQHCLGDILSVSYDQTPYNATGFNVTFYPVEEPTLCFGLICAEPFQSRVATHLLTYPQPQFRIALHDGDVYASSPPLSGLPPSRFDVRSAYGSAPENATLRKEEMKKILRGFVDDRTRLFAVEITLLNPFYTLLTDIWIIFEQPVSGGIFAALEVRSATIEESKTKVGFGGGFLLAYAFFYLALLVGKCLWALVRRDTCIACNVGTSVLIFHCVKCAAPNELTLMVSACSKCAAPIPSLRHKCWRKMIDIWTLWTLVNYIACIIWRFSVMATMPYLRESVNTAIARKRDYPAAVSFESYGQATTLVKSAFHTVTICIVLTYIKLFTLICRGQTNSRFVRIFSYGLPELLPFVITVLFTIAGFSIAMHITLGYEVDFFSTVPLAFLANFRILTLNAEWAPNAIFERASAVVLLITYVITSAFMMMNLFPSVLSVAYRRAMNTPQYDTEVLSLWLMVKPLLRRFGMLRTRRIGKKRARSITASLEGSLADAEMGELGGGNSGRSLAQQDSEEDFSDTQSESGMSDSGHSDAGTAVLDDLKELDEMRVVASANGRDIRSQLELKHLEKLAETNYLAGLDLEDGINRTRDELAELRKELQQLTAVLPALGVNAMTRSRLQGGQQALVDDQDDEPWTTQVGRSTRSFSVRSADALGLMTPLTGADGDSNLGDDGDLLPPTAARGKGTAAKSVARRSAAAPPPTQEVKSARLLLPHVNSDDDDDLVDTADAFLAQQVFSLSADGSIRAASVQPQAAGSGSTAPAVARPRRKSTKRATFADDPPPRQSSPIPPSPDLGPPPTDDQDLAPPSLEPSPNATFDI